MGTDRPTDHPADDPTDHPTDRPMDDLDLLIERVAHVAQEAASVVVGLGILGINRVQALRRDLAERLRDDEPR